MLHSKSSAKYYLQQFQELMEEERTQYDREDHEAQLLLGMEKRAERMEDDLDTLEQILEGNGQHDGDTLSRNRSVSEDRE